MSQQKVYLHIGMNKTGTSAIQRFLTMHREQLKELNVLYPSTGRRGPAHHILSNKLGFAHGKASICSELTTEALTLQQELLEEVQTCGAKDIVLSSENFVIDRGIEPVKTFFNSFDVRVVVYLRRHDTWWQSAYAQAVKMVANPKWGRGLEAFIEYQKSKNKGNYRGLVDRWAKVFGKENIIVRPYEKEQNRPDLVSDFLHAIGRDDVAAQVCGQSGRVNERLSAQGLMLMELYQRLNLDADTRARLLKHAQSLQDDSGPVALASPAYLRNLVDENAEDYEYIAREYLGRADGRLFYAPLPDPDASWDKPKPPPALWVLEETVAALGVGKQSNT